MYTGVVQPVIGHPQGARLPDYMAGSAVLAQTHGLPLITFLAKRSEMSLDEVNELWSMTTPAMPYSLLHVISSSAIDQSRYTAWCIPVLILISTTPCSPFSWAL